MDEASATKPKKVDGATTMHNAAQDGREPWRSLVSERSRNDTAILETMTAFGAEGLTSQEIATLTDMPRTSASAHLCILAKRGIVVPTGQLVPMARGGLPAAKYRVASAAELPTVGGY